MGETAAHAWLLPAPLWQSLWLTLRLASITTLVLGFVGLPLAHWLNTARTRLAPFIETLVALPVVLPPTVIGFYLLVIFSPNHPPGSWWRAATGAPLAFSFTGLVIASVFYSLPFAVQPFRRRCAVCRMNSSMPVALLARAHRGCLSVCMCRLHGAG